MKLSCTQENLNHGLMVVSHLAGKNTTLPILDNVLLSASSGVLELATTNLEIGIKCFVRGKVEKPGKTTVQAKLLNDYVSLLPKNRVDIESLENSLMLKCDVYETTIRGSSAEDYPIIPPIEKKDPIVVEAQEFLSAISETVFAAATDETRPEISGVLMTVNNQELKLVATDSYRLAEKKVNLKKPNKVARQVIIPSRTLQELLRVLTIIEAGEIEIMVTENQIMFDLEETSIMSRVIEGRYPDYQQIIPQESKTSFTADKEELMRIIKTTSLFSKAGICDVNIKLNTKQNEAVVSAANTQVGEHVSRFSVKAEGDDNSIVFNHRYLLEGLQNIPTSEVVVELIDSANPGVIKPKNGEGYLYIIMPIRQ